MEAFTKSTRAEAWLQGIVALQTKQDRIHNLILEISDPTLGTPQSRQIEKRVDSFLREHSCQPLNTVAETIFPATEYRQGGLDAVYKYPINVYPLIQPVNAWGTYALRITERKCSDGSTFNPLKFLIEKLRRQIGLKSSKRAVYELDSMSEPLDLKLYEADVDRNNNVAGQCLSHLSFKLGSNHELYLTAVYRYQWYIQKALGNLLGLARLQACVAREVGVPVGPLVCLASLAVLEDESVQSVPWAKSDINTLIKDCKHLSVQNMEAAA